MNLYLISQDENDDYDTFDSAIVCAPDEESARQTHPTGDPAKWLQEASFCSWCESPSSVRVKLIGVAAEGIEPGVICASFNAG